MIHYRATQDLPAAELHPYPGNPRRGNVEEITRSLVVSGQYRSVVVWLNGPDGPTVLAGNHTVKAARQIAELVTLSPAAFAKKTRVTEDAAQSFLASGSQLLHGLVRCDTLECSETDAARIVAADNRLADLGTYDLTDLAMLLEAAGELQGTGYTDLDLERLLALAGGDPEAYSDVDDAPGKPLASLLTEPGDVWVMGERDQHRLVVGDATSVEDVTRVMNGDRADLLLTDPPYGVAYQSADGKKIKNDDLGWDELGELLSESFHNAFTVMRPGAPYYVFSPSGRLETLFRLKLDEVMELRQQLVWVKDALVLGRSDYQLRHESILYGWRGADGEPVEPGYDVAHDTVLYGWKKGTHSWEGDRSSTRR